MLSDNLFREVLLKTATEAGVNRLRIVSGFATASMASTHMEKLAEIGRPISIELIVGMTRRSGIEKAQHYALQKLTREGSYGMDFSCRYVVKGNPVHAKTYCWFQGNQPCAGFTGSANYTWAAFGRGQIETMEVVSGQATADFYRRILRQTADCMDDDIEDKVTLIETRQTDAGKRTRDDGKRTRDAGEKISSDGEKPRDDGVHVTLSLLDGKTGKTPTRSGVNWGQRTNRDRNQAYIHIPANIGRSGFFPNRFAQFTVMTDDGHSFIMVRAQDGGKGLHTTQDNALLGRYLRARMGIPSGTYLTHQHLVEYGRTDITFIKIDDETYLLDFQPNVRPSEDTEES